MTLALLLPLGLAALAAMLVPLLLHLNRQPQHRPTPFAALRWLRGPARPRRRVRMDQWPLLLLRLLLLAVLALLLAVPVWRGSFAGARDVVAVLPGIDAAQARAALAAPDAQWIWLQPGFPPLSEDAAAGAAPPVGSLLRELDSTLPADARLHVIVPSLLAGLDGGTIRLSRDVDWHTINRAPDAPDTVPEATLRRLSLRAPAEAAAAVYLRAAVAAGNSGGTERYRLVADAPEAPIAADTDAVFWLAGEPSPALLRWIGQGGTALVDAPPHDRGDVVARDAQGRPQLRIERLAQGRLLRFAAALNAAELPLVLDAEFPALLFGQLFPADLALDRASAAAVQPTVGAARADAAARPLSPALIVLAALLALAERLLSWHLGRQAP